MRTTSPYNYNMPVEPEMFFGRQGDVEALVRGLTAAPGDSFALIGGRRMGKTSLLEALCRALDARLGMSSPTLLPIPIHLDLSGEGIDSTIAFFRTVNDLAQIRLAELLGPSQVTVFVGRGQAPAPEFGRVLSAWQQAVMSKQGYSLRLILLLDECEQIVGQAWVSDLHAALRYLLDGHATRLVIKVVMAGSHAFLSQVRSHGSPLWNVLKYHRLQVFDAQATSGLIEQPTEGVLPEEVVQAVAQQSGGHPFLTQYIMHHLWERGLEHATSDVVRQVANRFSHERSDFQDWIDALGDTAVKVHGAIAGAGKPLDESTIRATLNPAPPDLLQALDALCYHGLIVRDDREQRYRIAGTMFQDWYAKNVALSSIVAPSTQPDFRYDVFVGYNHKDIAWVRDTLLPRLEQDGLRVCIDYRDFEIGVPSLVNMERAVDHSRHTLLVLTPAWVESEWTEFESLLAGTADPAGRRQKLIPLMLEACKPPPRIAMLTYADFTKLDEREAQLSRVVAAIRGELRLQEVGSSLQRLPVPVKPGITEQTTQIHKKKEALSPKTVESEIPFATVPPMIPFEEQARREWRGRIDDGFEPIPFESPNANRPYGHADAPTGNVVLGTERIPFSLPPYQMGNGHRIIEVHPQHARDQVARDIRPAEVRNVVALYMLLSAGDTRRMRGEQKFEGKEIGRLQISFSDRKTPQIVPLRLGIEIREWVSGDMTWNVVAKASAAEEIWCSPDRRCTIDMIRIDIQDGPKDVSTLTVVGECKWLPKDYGDALPSVRISGVTYKTVEQAETGQVRSKKSEQ